MSIEVTSAAHAVSVRDEVKDRVLKRRGRYHWFETFDPKKTAFVVIDMQETFCAVGGPGEVPASRAIVPQINDFNGKLRALGVPVIWVLHANTHVDGRSDWPLFYDYVVA